MPAHQGALIAGVSRYWVRTRTNPWSSTDSRNIIGGPGTEGPRERWRLAGEFVTRRGNWLNKPARRQCSQGTQSESIHVVAGETLSVKMGDAGSRISGTLRIPDSQGIEGAWVESLREIDDNLPKPPPEIVSNSKAIAEWRLQPGIRERLLEASRRIRFVMINEDRQFVIDSVEPGRYELVFFSKPSTPNAKIRGVARQSLEITPDLQGGELNLGVIEAVRH